MSQDARHLGRYRIESVLGRGAMGVVYAAVDTRLGRRVAIKTVQRGYLADESTASDYAARFEREAQAAARLSRPHIVTIFDFGEQDGESYIVMEFIPGLELAKVIDSGERFTLQQTVTLIGELLDALGAAHVQGIVHRDVKPANVMLDAAGHVKLADFGVARLVDNQQDRTMPGTLVGTPSYMSPEQILGQAVGSRTDLFAVGVLLYQLLTGHKPFQGRSAFDMQKAILQSEPAPPSSVQPGCRWASTRSWRTPCPNGPKTGRPMRRPSSKCCGRHGSRRSQPCCPRRAARRPSAARRVAGWGSSWQRRRPAQWPAWGCGR